MSTKIFFSTDVHGATAVWKKWIQAPKIYGVNVLMLCGDLTGKFLVPIVNQGNGNYKVFYLGENLTLSTDKEVLEVEKKLLDTGIYLCRCHKQELEKLKEDPKAVEELIKEEMRKRMGEWMNLILEKIDTKRIKVIIMPGNDDYYLVDSIIQSYTAHGIIWCLDRVIEINGAELISLAHTNPTPWNTTREASEKELAKMIEGLVGRLKDSHKAIFNFHSPPYGTRIDLSPELDKNKKPVIIAGQISYTHVGSKSVRKAIEKYQPILGLHGHIHESQGVEKIGKTICINPGSEYDKGILKGYVIEIAKGEVKNYWRVEG